MSLDVYLTGAKAMYPCSECGHPREDEPTLFSANITHNLTRMAGEAGIYQHLWRPEELKITRAGDLVEPLERGLAIMKADPARFEKLNPPNGWGSYRDFVPWIEEYLAACREHPEARVSVSR